MTADIQTIPTAACAFPRESYRALCERIDEPDWLRSHRQEAWERLQGSGPLSLPTDKSQKSLQPLPAATLAAVPALPGDVVAQIAPPTTEFEEADWGELAGSSLTYGGSAVRTVLWDTWRENGVILTDLATAVRQYPDLVQPHFTAPVTVPERQQLTAWHEAFRCESLFLYVPRGVVVTYPILLGHRLTRGGVASFPYTLIVADRDSQVDIIEDLVSADTTSPSLYNGMVDIHLKSGAHLTYQHLQGWGANVYHYLQQRSFLERDASITTFSAQTGGQLSYAYTETNLRGQGSQGIVLGLISGERNQSFLSRTVQNHVGSHTTSDLLVKAVLKDESHSDYGGWINIEKAAMKADAYQLQRNLLLSGKARADSIPNLEILANDVRCSHGAAVGSIDEEHLFYLRARGLTYEAAERMIVEGFAEQVLQRIPRPEIRDRIGKVVRTRLGFTGEEG